MKKRYIFIGIIVVLLIVLAANSVYTVNEDEYACTFRFSEIVQTKSEPGLYFKIPFVDSVEYFTKAAMLYDIPPSEVLTSDKQNMTVDCYILWQITDPQQFYRSLGTTSVAEERLNTITYNALKTAMGKLAQADIINEEDGAERNKIYEGISETVDQQAGAYGIRVEDVKIKRFDLPESNLNAVYDRMISERNRIAAEFSSVSEKNATVKRNDVDKRVNVMISNAEAAAAVTIAEGEGEYMRMLAEAYDSPDEQEFYEFILALDALKASLNGDEKTVILDADSELGRILTGVTGE